MIAISQVVDHDFLEGVSSDVLAQAIAQSGVVDRQAVRVVNQRLEDFLGR